MPYGMSDVAKLPLKSAPNWWSPCLKTVAGAKEQGLSNQVLTVTILTHKHHFKKFFYFECTIHAIIVKN